MKKLTLYHSDTSGNFQSSRIVFDITSGQFECCGETLEDGLVVEQHKTKLSIYGIVRLIDYLDEPAPTNLSLTAADGSSFQIARLISYGNRYVVRIMGCDDQQKFFLRLSVASMGLLKRFLNLEVRECGKIALEAPVFGL